MIISVLLVMLLTVACLKVEAKLAVSMAVRVISYHQSLTFALISMLQIVGHLVNITEHTILILYLMKILLQ